MSLATSTRATETTTTGAPTGIFVPTVKPVTYEYLAVPLNQEREGVIRDSYASFGWETEGLPSGIVSADTLKLKRDRSISDRPMVNELQRRAEGALAGIERLERSKTTAARIVSWVIGLAGVVLMGASVFSYEASMMVPSVVLGVLGIIMWIVPLFTFRGIRARRRARVTPMISRQYSLLYDACEQAQRLLA